MFTSTVLTVSGSREHVTGWAVRWTGGIPCRHGRLPTSVEAHVACYLGRYRLPDGVVVARLLLALSGRETIVICAVTDLQSTGAFFFLLSQFTIIIMMFLPWTRPARYCRLALDLKLECMTSSP